MTITIQPSLLGGQISAPPSKSVAQRALAISWLRRAQTTLYHTGRSADELAVLQLMKNAGCVITATGDRMIIDSAHTVPLPVASFGESGLAARMLTPILALQENEVQLQGSGSLVTRPMDALCNALEELGVQVSGDGRLPFSIHGPLRPAPVTVDGSISSQTITGLLLAFSAAGADNTRITVQHPVSKPYLALTLKVMDELRMAVPKHDASYTYFDFSRRQPFTGNLEYTVEGDWSAAAFLAVAGAIAGDISIRGLDVFTEQGDKSMLQPLMDAGARMSITLDEIIVRHSALKAFHFNATDHPDLFPPLAVLAAYCNGTSVIEGVHRLAHKESNRAATLQEELGKMNIDISFQDDMMLIQGGRQVKGAHVHARNDHRIAMACAVAALGADGPTTIDGADAVAKSWPSFFGDLKTLNANIHTV